MIGKNPEYWLRLVSYNHAVVLSWSIGRRPLPGRTKTSPLRQHSRYTNTTNRPTHDPQPWIVPHPPSQYPDTAPHSNPPSSKLSSLTSSLPLLRPNRPNQKLGTHSFQLRTQDLSLEEDRNPTRSGFSPKTRICCEEWRAELVGHADRPALRMKMW